jgi:hypothetical protein
MPQYKISVAPRLETVQGFPGRIVITISTRYPFARITRQILLCLSEPNTEDLFSGIEEKADLATKLANKVIRDELQEKILCNGISVYV